MGWWTVRPRWADGPPLYFNFVPERLFLWSGLKSLLRTVRSLGADGPQANLKVVPETILVSGGVELLTADGPPLGRGQSARA